MTEPTVTEPAVTEPTAAGRDPEAEPVDRRGTIALRGAAVLTLIGLALMVWSILVPTPLPVMLAMTVGQAIGTTAFALYLYIVVRALRRELRR